MLPSSKTLELSTILINRARRAGITVSTAESCTGGMLSACITAIPGSSDVFSYGFITYSNKSKSALLGIDPALINKHSPISKEVAEAMAIGCLRASKAQLAISITGIAGPDGGNEQIPVGTVYIGVAKLNKNDFKPVVYNIRLNIEGGRAHIREEACYTALQEMCDNIK
ncbi:MAG: CinA family protein [Proteobacteria bacterium]|nr:CinA family protein [Pseudomonadota bacterium]